MTRPIAGGLLEAGGQVARTVARLVPRSADAGAFTASSWQRSAYAHFVWAATPTLTVSPGVRITDSTLLPYVTTTPWILGEWTFRTGWMLNASAGISHQLPDIHHVLGEAGSKQLRPERATHIDVGIEQRVTRSIRWQVTAFNRHENDILREPDIHPRLVGGVVVGPVPGRYRNVLQGSSRGVELIVDRSSATGLSGWAAYAYSRTRHTDADRNETFWADFDQRHALNVYGDYRFSKRAGVGATFRAGTNFPIPAYLMARDGRLVVAARRNEVRMPAYVRLDVRADRRLEYFGRHLTLFVDLLNVLNRANAGLANGSIDPTSGEAIGFTDTPFPRRVSAGVLIEF